MSTGAFQKFLGPGVILYPAVATVADICELSQFTYIYGSGHTMSKYCIFICNMDECDSCC